MILKRLIEILKTFDKDELKKFSRFIRSDYFNTNQRVTELFRVLKQFHPVFEDKKLTNEYLFKQIYGSRNFDDKTFRYLLAELFELAEKFVALTYIEDDKVEANKNLINGLIARLLFSQANSLLKATDNNPDVVAIMDGDFLKNKIDHYQLWHNLLFLTNKMELLSSKSVDHGDFLTVYNLIELFHLHLTINTNKVNMSFEPEDNTLAAFVNNFNYEGMLEYLDRIGKDFKANKVKSNLINSFKIYLCLMISSLNSKDEFYFRKMRDLVNEYGKFFDNEEHQNLHIMLLNLCNLKMKSIDYEKYLKNYFDVVKSALSKNLLTAYKGQYMEVSGFYKIFQTAIYLKEYEWVEYFTGKYVNRLSPEYREDSLNYAEAELCFWNRRFEESLKLLSKVKYSFPGLKLNVRALTLMIYYELEHIEEAFSLTDSFSHLLTSNSKIKAEQKLSSLNFVFYLRKLLKYKDRKPAEKTASTLRNKILNTSPVNNKSWLLSKAEELLKAST